MRKAQRLPVIGVLRIVGLVSPGSRGLSSGLASEFVSLDSVGEQGCWVNTTSWT